MPTTIELPLWAFALLLAFAVASILERVFLPSVRWFFRRRINRAINEVNSRLKVSIRPFHLTKRQVIIDRVVYDTEVIAVMQDYAREHDMPYEVAQAKVVEYAHEIVPAFNAYIYFRIGYWVSRKIARLVYRVHVGFETGHRLATLDRNATVVFVMNHRSNMDYVLVSYLVSEESTLSYAVGEWARVWPLQMLVRAMGAFFVRRNSGDALYRKVLERYVAMATNEGVCQAVFIEGGLSHDGRLREPRLGFLDYMLRSYDGSRDLIFIPVGINYDRILEDRSLLIRRAPSAPKRSKWFVIKTTWGFYRKVMALSIRDRRKRFGFAAVNFARPRSLKAYCAERGIRFPELPKETRIAEVQRLADTLMDDIARVTPVLPAPLVATVMQEAGDESLGEDTIQRRAHELFKELQTAGAPLRDNECPKERTIHTAIEALTRRGLLTQHEDGHYQANPEERELLHFYANSLAHWRNGERRNAQHQVAIIQD